MARKRWGAPSPPSPGTTAAEAGNAGNTLWRVPSRSQVVTTVYDAIATLWPGRFDGEELAEDVSLGSAGLGLDSIEIVELLLECEERLGDGNRAEELLEAGPIMVGSLIDHLSRP
jgi:acyl carrier protein